MAATCWLVVTCAGLAPARIVEAGYRDDYRRSMDNSILIQVVHLNQNIPLMMQLGNLDWDTFVQKYLSLLHLSMIIEFLKL